MTSHLKTCFVFIPCVYAFLIFLIFLCAFSMKMGIHSDFFNNLIDIFWFIRWRLFKFQCFFVLRFCLLIFFFLMELCFAWLLFLTIVATIQRITRKVVLLGLVFRMGTIFLHIPQIFDIQFSSFDIVEDPLLNFLHVCLPSSTFNLNFV